MDEMSKSITNSSMTGSTLERWKYAIQDKAFDLIRSRAILETNSGTLLRVLESGTAATNVFLRRIHNFALGKGWLAWPILPREQWPALRYGKKRPITAEEHERILNAERNPEWNRFYGYAGTWADRKLRRKILIGRIARLRSRVRRPIRRHDSLRRAIEGTLERISV